MRIKKISALEILDSRGFPTLKTYVELENGIVGTAAVPSGASTGTYEACELRDNDPKRYHSKGVLMAKHHVENLIEEALIGHSAQDQKGIDNIMIKLDGTPNKNKLGANAILSVSLAAAVAAARAQNRQLYQYLKTFFDTGSTVLPVPMINVINGGKHAEQSTDFQEYMLIPYGFTKFSEALRAATEVFHTLKKKLHDQKQPTTVGDEGGFAPHFKNNREPLQLLTECIEEAGYLPGEEFGLGLDVAANEFFNNGTYVLASEEKKLSREKLSAYYVSLKNDFPLCSIEDPFHEDDWQGFINLTHETQNKIQVVGDDLYVTNIERFKKGIATHATNAILVKLNQIGTLSETIEVINLAKKSGKQAVVSHRSGETEDTFIADLVVAAACGQIKTGSLSRSERLAKYNRLLEIEHQEQSVNFGEFPYKIIPTIE